MVNKKSFIKIVAALLSAYILCYALIRLDGRMIIHYLSTDTCKYRYHQVEMGDTGFLGRIFYAAAAVVFTPLRFLELQYWNLAQPPGSMIWEQDRHKFESCKNQV